MHSDFPPEIVLPDNQLGHRLRDRDYREFGDAVHFCRDSRMEETDRAMPRCANRDPSGEKAHNWCFRCPCGYIFTLLGQKGEMHESTR